MNSDFAIKERQYDLLFKQVDNLLNSADPVITNLSNITAAINDTFSFVSWVGFYISKGDTLYLGPFQGKVACTKIELGKGVCGTAAALKETQVVENVNNFPGHIACDVESLSEIVVPIIAEGKVQAVLDLDSREYSAFNDIDKRWLEKICQLIIDKVRIHKNILD
jgi:GAF domain-containing protein